MFARPRSAIVWTSGCFVRSHMIICGLVSSGAATATVGSSVEFWMASSVDTRPSVIALSAYSCALTCWKPIAAPP